jgi:para-nitrobenzyl esterase
MEASAKTTSGMVGGVGLGGGVIGFRGIPYAAAPVGSRRFRPPQRPEPWDGVRALRDERALWEGVL